MRPLLIRDATLVLPEGPRRGALLCAGGVIVAIDPDDPPPAVEVLDARGAWAGPGFVDIHVHGGWGHSFLDGGKAAVAAYAHAAPAAGVTAFLVSTAGPGIAGSAARLRALGGAIAVAAGGAEPLGIHLEGPCLSPLRRGAYPEAYLAAPGDGLAAQLQEAAGGQLRMVTIAPELDGATAFASACSAAGIVAAMGHTDATYTTAQAALDGPFAHVTHLFNAMRPIHQRDGGPAVAALSHPTASAEIICDGVHVAPEMVRLAWDALGPERFVAVTDGLAVAGLAAGEHTFAGQPLRVEGRTARRDDGTIAGSVATMDEHFRNLAGWIGDVPAAFRACSTNPARVAGAGGRKGSLEPGMDADIVLLDPESLEAGTTICGGVIAFRRR